MAYCRFCGKPIAGEECTCDEYLKSIGKTPKKRVFNTKFRLNFSSGPAFVSSFRDQFGFGDDSIHKEDPFETNVPVVPDCIEQEDNEIIVKQYNIAKLRTRIKFMWAEGRMMITNKRLLFRAAGTSLTGDLLQEHQFTLDEIAGVEFQRDNKFSFLNLLGTLFVANGGLMAVLIPLVVAFVLGFKNAIENAESMSAMKTLSTVCVILAFFFLIFGLIGVLASIFLYQKQWLKVLLSGAAEAFPVLSIILFVTFGLGKLDKNAMIAFIVIGAIVLLISVICTIINSIIVCFVPNLVITIKTKGGQGAISVGSKNAIVDRDYSGFMEVLPWEDTNMAINELGTMIDDLQKMGDYAVEKWSK